MNMVMPQQLSSAGTAAESACREDRSVCEQHWEGIARFKDYFGLDLKCEVIKENKVCGAVY